MWLLVFIPAWYMGSKREHPNRARRKMPGAFMALRVTYHHWVKIILNSIPRSSLLSHSFHNITSNSLVVVSSERTLIFHELRCLCHSYQYFLLSVFFPSVIFLCFWVKFLCVYLFCIFNSVLSNIDLNVIIIVFLFYHFFNSAGFSYCLFLCLFFHLLFLKN